MIKYTKQFSVLVMLLCIAPFLQAAPNADTVFRVKIDLAQKAQVMANIGSSACWFAEGIGKYWPMQKKEKIAQLLFSRNFGANGQPEGIGLSAWRFNIGAGTLEQGVGSGIKDFRRRADSFLAVDGSYDWDKQAGQQFFLQKAHNYGVETLIAFSNSPPVQLTKNGLGFKTEKDFVSNLREDAYSSYADFLAQVVKHFAQKGLNFKYISPVNEPQWAWSNLFNEGTQEGSPWTNAEIYQIAQTLNTALLKEKLDTKILLTEAATLTYLYGGTGKAANQIQQFFGANSALQLSHLRNVPKLLAGHSYFTESDDHTLLNARKHLADTAKKYGIDFWQTEYSMLGDGFREGRKGNRTAMDCALFLAKVIHTDLTVANASAWQFWNAFEPGRADVNTRYYLIALKPQADFMDGEFTVTKNLWALGHFSRFIRPGMTRVATHTFVGREQVHNPDLLLSAYIGQDQQLIAVAINYGQKPIQLKLTPANTQKKYAKLSSYLTSDAVGNNMKAEGKQPLQDVVWLPARSISTVIVE